MGLHETVLEYWREPQSYAVWTVQPNSPVYTPNCILHALQFQATIHWNCCGNNCNGRCTDAAKQNADTYMAELKKGRYDLHPSDDQAIHMLAFDIHNKLVEEGNHFLLDNRKAGKPGIMTCTYVVGAGSSEACACYTRGHAQWLVQSREKQQREVASRMIISPDDQWFEPRFD